MDAAMRARLEDSAAGPAPAVGVMRTDLVALLAAYDAQAARLAALEAMLEDERLQRRADMEREA